MRSVRIGVVGAGLFGITAAVTLARHHDVDLFEASTEILAGASMKNHGRLHDGYHYPRSIETARQCREGSAAFSDWFPDAIQQSEQYIGIAKHGSRTTAQDYVRFLQDQHLAYERIKVSEAFNPELIDAAFLVPEARIDLHALKMASRALIREAPVTVHLSTRFSASMIANHDAIVLATYAGLAALHLPNLPRLRYDAVHKTLIDSVDVPYPTRGRLVLDGPFVNVSPYTADLPGVLMVGDAATDTVSRTIGLGPLTATKAATRHPTMRPRLHRYLTGFESTHVLGTLATTRVTLDGVDRSDARPTLISRLFGNVWLLLGGKLVTAVQAATQLSAAITASTTAA